MPDLVSSVQIVASDETSTAYAAATANSNQYTGVVQANAAQFQRIRSGEEAVDASWAEALEENAARAAMAEQERAAAAVAAAARVQAAIVEQEAKYQELGRVIMATAQSGNIAGAIGGLGAIAGVGMMGMALEHIVEKTKDEAMELGHLSTATGISVTNLAEMEAELKRVGASQVNVNMLVVRMSAALEAAHNPTSMQYEKLRELGVNTEALRNGTMTMMEAQQELAIHLANSTKAEQDLSNMRAIAGRNAVPYVAFLKEEGENLQKNLEKHRDLGMAMEGAVPAAKTLQQAEAGLGEEWKQLSAVVLPAVTYGLKGIIEVFEFLAVGAAAMANAVVGVFKVIWEAALGGAKVWKDVMTGHWGAVTADAKSAALNVGGAWSNLWESQKALSMQYFDDVKKRWETLPVEKPTGDTDTDPAGGKKKKSKDVELEGAMRHQEALNAAMREGIEARAKLNDYNADLTAGLMNAQAKRELDSTESLLAQKLALAKQSDDPDKAQTVLNEVQAAHDKYNAEVQKNNERAAEDNKKLLDTEAKAAEKVVEGSIVADAKRNAEFQKTLALMEKSEKEHAEKAIKVAAIQSEARVAAAKSSADMQRLQINAAYDAGNISLAERVKRLKEVEEAEYRVASMAAHQEVGAAAETEKKIQELTAAHNLAIEKINIDGAKKSEKPWLQYFQSLESNFNRSINSMITGHEKFGKAVQSMWQGFVTDSLQALERVAEQWLVKHVIMAAIHKMFTVQNAAVDTAAKAGQVAANNAANIAMATSDVGMAAATAFADAMAEIPFPANLAAAPAAGWSAFSEGSPFIAMASAARGADLPGENTMIFAHPREMVLPESLANVVRSVAAQGGSRSGGGTTNNYQGYPGESPHSVTQNAAAWQRAHRDGRLRFA